MRTLNLITPALVAVLLVLAAMDSAARAQSMAAMSQQVNSQAQWMNAWLSWTNAWVRGNAQAQMVEAQAKLIAARAGIVTAVANAKEANAKALQGLEQARSLALDNDLKKAETFYGKRALYENHRNLAKARPRPSEEDLLRYSRASTPQRLTPGQLDPIRGEIHWPPLLQRDQFAEHRERIDDLFVQRLDYGQDIHQEVQDLSKEIHTEMCSLVREVPSAEYIQARKFIRSLAYDSQFPPRIDGLAAN